MSYDYSDAVTILSNFNGAVFDNDPYSRGYASDKFISDCYKDELFPNLKQTYTYEGITITLWLNDVDMNGANIVAGFDGVFDDGTAVRSLNQTDAMKRLASDVGLKQYVNEVAIVDYITNFNVNCNVWIPSNVMGEGESALEGVIYHNNKLYLDREANFISTKYQLSEDTDKFLNNYEFLSDW